MQGYTVLDDKENKIRVIDFIRGQTIFNYVYEINKNHEQYFYEDLPRILHHLRVSIEAIKYLHDHEFCHGDIRNDHIIIDSETGEYRWIDYDLQQNVSDFDVWSMGNIISYAVGKGINSFKSVLKSQKFSDEIKNSLTIEDASAFYEYRVMNLIKLFPYIPERLSDILLHFTLNPQPHYETLTKLLDDYDEMLATEFPKT
jgi:serine/threonine protein kinase